MQLSTTDKLGSREYTPIGITKGNVVWAENFIHGIQSRFKSFAGGELRHYTKMLEGAREIATQRMIDNAALMGADGIVCMRYSTYYIMGGVAEVMAYGTAVKCK